MTTAHTYDPDYVGRALDELIEAIHNTAKALERAELGDSLLHRDVLACRALIGGLYHRLPTVETGEAGR